MAFIRGSRLRPVLTQGDTVYRAFVNSTWYLNHNANTSEVLTEDSTSFNTSPQNGDNAKVWNNNGVLTFWNGTQNFVVDLEMGTVLDSFGNPIPNFDV